MEHEARGPVNIVMVVDDYFPSTTSAAQMMKDLAEEAVAHGHKVALITATRKITADTETTAENGVTVIRVRAGKNRRRGFASRAIAEIFLPFVTWRRTRTYLEDFKPGLVVWYSPTIFWGWFISRIRARNPKCTAYLILRDFFPDWAVELGLLKRHGPAHLFFSLVARFQYSVAHIIGVQSVKALANFTTRQPGLEGKTEVLWNWSEFGKAPSAPEPRGSRVLLLYGGNLGHAQGRAMLALVEQLRHAAGIEMMIAASGIVAEEIRTLDLPTNVIATDPLPPDQYSALIRKCDVGLVTLSAGLQSPNVPGKFVAYLSAGKPVVADVNQGSDLIELISKHEVGYVSINDPARFAANVIKLCTDEESRLRMGRRAIQLSKELFSVGRASRQILSAHDRMPE